MVDVIFCEKSKVRFGSFYCKWLLAVPSRVLLHLNTIWQLFSHKKEEEGGRVKVWWGCNSVLWASFFIPRPVINTPQRGGETEMLPRQMACCCIRRDFCSKHEKNITRRGRKKGGGGLVGGGNRLLWHLKFISLLERWREFHFGGEQTKSLGDI